ncbi:RNA polymerase sigma-70 factor, ECF subfamily [Nocardioides scoriae]|uniref:RNA polymerase sigma-70 factor, ECF subfamily n=1 Tax=Nocardioides scoriae TaxID=642780 RepID=A0A1H1SRI4_9ACTN|nr:RNA polymerase sigma factor [Nocardioides scoriae]SDS50602.1 RNA polymerase sigma-70 factor, ECF subfamily [Nocardioides scoriae]
MPDDDALAAATQQALARRAGLGDRAAYEELFRRLFPSTFRFALRMLDSDTGLAEDTVQEAWVKAWRGLPDFRGTSTFSTWLFSIVSREALEVRRRRRPVALDGELLEPILDRSTPASARPQDPAQAVLADELWHTLTLALMELPWRQRASWLLRELEGFSYDDIARVLDTTPTVVRGQLHRARRTLAIRMEQWR